MEKYADLHIHTNYSDGTFAPQEAVDLAKDLGLSCISITDHDSLDGFNSLKEPYDIEVLPGVELSAEDNDVEVHILGYLVDNKDLSFLEELVQMRKVRVTRMQKMCAKLTELGMEISLDEVLALAGNNCVGRLHLARLMVKKGYIATIFEAFHKYIGNNGPAYVSRFKLTPGEAIELILEYKGIPVLAHPHSIGNQDLIEDYIRAGIMGIEAIYSEYTPAQSNFYLSLAKKHNLLVSGGSDCHGNAKPEVKMGSVKIPYELVVKLKEAGQQKLRMPHT